MFFTFFVFFFLAIVVDLQTVLKGIKGQATKPIQATKPTHVLKQRFRRGIRTDNIEEGFPAFAGDHVLKQNLL